MDTDFENLSLVTKIGAGSVDVLAILDDKQYTVPLLQSAASGVAVGDLVLLNDDRTGLVYK